MSVCGFVYWDTSGYACIVCKFDFTACAFQWESYYSIKVIGSVERINLVQICQILHVCVKTCCTQ